MNLKYFEKRNEKTEKEYQDYKKIFEVVKELILKYKNNNKK